MLFDVVQEVQAQAEGLVSSRLKLVERDVEELKRGLKALTDDCYKRQGKLQQYTLGLVIGSAMRENANTLKQ